MDTLLFIRAQPAKAIQQWLSALRPGASQLCRGGLSRRLVRRSLDEGKGTRTSSFESRSISAGRMTEFFVSFAWCKNNHARSLSEFCRGQTGTRKGAEHKETKLAKRALAFPIPTGLKLGPAPSTAPWQAILKGLQSLSPGLRGTSYPVKREKNHNPERVEPDS
jgi:hypothetical protein